MTRAILCRALAAAMFLLPMQAARADMITLDRALAGHSEREEALVQLQARGISSDAARERVAALTDEEAAALANELEALPAGGNAALAFIVIALFFAFVIRQMYEKNK